MEIPESQDSRDARIQQLWQKLDPQKKGELDLTGLRKGLSRIDHREQASDLSFLFSLEMLTNRSVYSTQKRG